MATRVLTKAEADRLGLAPKRELGTGRGRRINPHVNEIMEQVKSAKPGQFVVYEPADNKSYQSQVLRIRQAFDTLGKPWPQTKPMDKGKYAVLKILSRAESLDRYPQQPLSKSNEPAPVAEPKPARTAKPVRAKGPRGRKKGAR